VINLPPGIKGSKRARDWLGCSEFARLFNICVEEMVRDGYAPSTLEKRIGGITHFLYWFKRKGRRVCSIKTHVVEQFMVGHLARCRCAQLCVYNARTMRLALDVLLRILRRRGQKVDPRVPRSGVKAELSAYDTYLTDVSGLTSDTRRSYLGEVENFLSRQFGTGKVDIAILAPEAVRRFIKEMSSRRLHLHHIVVALRNYFRFKAVGGGQVSRLLAAIPKTAQWRLARLPKTLTPAETARLLASFDRTTGQGRRDYAMARCLTDLGLRAGETARLQLDDVDWRAGTVRIVGKGQRMQVLPLTQAVGAALAEYMSKSRPKTSSRTVFMQLHAPIVAVTANIVGNAMSLAAQRCGLQDKVKGSHVLRHSIAARLLSSGATLKGIADVLRHSSFDTTRIYTKVDLQALRRVAMPWVGRTG
jgi:site-specific recombinase XerD